MSKDINETILKDAQYRKGLSIAFFNATNSAIALVVPLIDEGTDMDLVLKRVFEIRDAMLEEHKNYYATVIAKVGVNYKVEDAIKRLEATTNYEELASVYLSFSEDERRDPVIKAKAQELKLKYEKA